MVLPNNVPSRTDYNRDIGLACISLAVNVLSEPYQLFFTTTDTYTKSHSISVVVVLSLPTFTDTAYQGINQDSTLPKETKIYTLTATTSHPLELCLHILNKVLCLYFLYFFIHILQN